MKEKQVYMELSFDAVERKTLLYQTEFEKNLWACNHIQGCAHSCRFPCYAYLMSKRFGRVNDFKDWEEYRVVRNAREIMKNDLEKHWKKIGAVHFCFMTDPFMYDGKQKRAIREIGELSLDLARMVNQYGIPVRTLTKGLTPEILAEGDFLKENEYGITLVSLDESFRSRFEPYTAPYRERIESLHVLSRKGCRTWVCMEPYPTPNIAPEAENIDRLLEELRFVDSFIFGKLNYNKTVEKYPDKNIFYKNMTEKVLEFCKKNNKRINFKEEVRRNVKRTDGKSKEQLTFDQDPRFDRKDS